MEATRFRARARVETSPRRRLTGVTLSRLHFLTGSLGKRHLFTSTTPHRLLFGRKMAYDVALGMARQKGNSKL
jgi:hypothetical protein